MYIYIYICIFIYISMCLCVCVSYIKEENKAYKAALWKNEVQ